MSLSDGVGVHPSFGGCAGCCFARTTLGATVSSTSRESPELARLLELGPGHSKEEVFTALAPELEQWRRNGRLATALLSALARRQQHELACQVLSFMRERRAEVNVYHCTAAISACEKAGKWQMALDTG
ncbi:unnamed protein product, partial [Polarella glacialis]